MQLCLLVSIFIPNKGYLHKKSKFCNFIRNRGLQEHLAASCHQLGIKMFDSVCRLSLFSVIVCSTHALGVSFLVTQSRQIIIKTEHFIFNPQLVSCSLTGKKPFLWENKFRNKAGDELGRIISIEHRNWKCYLLKLSH